MDDEDVGSSGRPPLPDPAEPWTLDQYEALRKAVFLAVNAAIPITLESGAFYAGITGPCFWDLLAAIERDPIARPRPGRPPGRRP